MLFRLGDIYANQSSKTATNHFRFFEKSSRLAHSTEGPSNRITDPLEFLWLKKFTSTIWLHTWIDLILRFSSDWNLVTRQPNRGSPCPFLSRPWQKTNWSFQSQILPRKSLINHQDLLVQHHSVRCHQPNEYHEPWSSHSFAVLNGSGTSVFWLMLIMAKQP